MSAIHEKIGLPATLYGIPVVIETPGGCVHHDDYDAEYAAQQLAKQAEDSVSREEFVTLVWHGGTSGYERYAINRLFDEKQRRLKENLVSHIDNLIEQYLIRSVE